MALLDQCRSTSTIAFDNEIDPNDHSPSQSNKMTRQNKIQSKSPFSNVITSHPPNDRRDDPDDRPTDQQELPNFNADPNENQENEDSTSENAVVIKQGRKSIVQGMTTNQGYARNRIFDEQTSNISNMQQESNFKDEQELDMLDLQINKKRLEMELMELTILQKKKKEQLDRSNSLLQKSRSRSQFGRTAREESKTGSFEYFDQQDLESSQNNSPRPQQSNTIQVKSHSILQPQVANNHMKGGEGTRIRPKSAIKDGTRNSRFLETDQFKKSKISKFDQDYEESPRNSHSQNIINTEQNMTSTQIQVEDGIAEQTSMIVGNSTPIVTLNQGLTLQRSMGANQQLLNKNSYKIKIEPSERISEISHPKVEVKKNKKNQKSKMSEKGKSTVRQQKKGGDGPDDDGPGSFPSPMEMLGNFDEDEGELNFFEPISYSKLEKVISQRHPLDPETKDRFSIKDRVTVIEYEAKLSDMCYCYAANKFFKEKAKQLRKMVKGPKLDKIERPPSMKDLPESNSSSDDEGDNGTKGLTTCSIALGEGATLYLQMMKTLSIMFVILTIMNIPLFCFYELNTTGNQLGDFTKAFKYFTLGNLGQMDKRCSWSSFESHFNETVPHQDFVSVDCGQGYIGELKEFGFLYQFDKLYGGDTVASERCKFIENPMIRYKKPAPKPICTDEQLEQMDDPETQDICRVVTPEELAKQEAEALETKNKPKKIKVDKDKNATEDIDIKLTPNNVDPECTFVNKTKKNNNKFWTSKDAELAFRTWFEKECYFNQSCTFDVNQIGLSFKEQQMKNQLFANASTNKFSVGGPNGSGNKFDLFDMVSDDCKQRMNEFKVTSYQYIGVVGCKYDDVLIPFSKDSRLHKEWIGIIILICDIVSILMMYYFFSSIRRLNLEILEAMDDLQVQMKDFGIKIDDVKLDRYTQDSRLIKMKIWLHFTKLFQNKDLMKEHAEEESDDEDSSEEEQNDQDNTVKIQSIKQLRSAKVHPIHQVLDVCLSIYTQPSIQCVFRMQDLQLEINDINNKLRTGGYHGEEIPDKQDELKALLEKQKRFEERYNQLTRKKKQKPGQSMTVERVPKSQRLKEIQYIFIIFKDCETASVIHSMYPQEKSILNKEGKDFELFGKQPKVVPILEPDEIIWENLAFAKDQQKVRSYIVEVISMFFLLGNTLFTMYLSGFKFYLNSKIPALNCDPELKYTKIDAYKDQMKMYEGDSPTGILSCYCSRETSLAAPWVLIPHNFAEFSDYIPDELKKTTDNWNYCAEWQLLQIAKQILMFLIQTSAVFINEIVADFFQQLGQFQKKHTKIEEQILCFRQIFIQEYINMGIIILVTSFDQIGFKATLLGDLAGHYNVYMGFDPNWYMEYGNKICVFIFMSSFVVNSKDVIKYIKTILKRFRDRSFKMNLKLDPEDEGCDQPNTKLRIQSDLEALYTGIPFKGEKAYSRMMSTMFVILMYSSGMPIMYFTGAVFYIVTFFVNKFLLINFYQKSRTLTRTIPLFAIDFMQYALFMHSFISLLMLTNPIAFKTKSRTDEDGVLMGVDPPINMTSAINNATVWLLSQDPSDLQQTIKRVDNNQIVKFLISRLQFFHQQMFLAFLITYVMIMFLGKTIYGILYLIFIIIFKMISSILQLIKKKMREANLRLQNKILKRQEAIKLSDQKHNENSKPEDSFKSDSSMKDEIISGLNSVNRPEDSKREEDSNAALIDNVFQEVFESPEEKAKREKREQKEQALKNSLVLKKLKRADYSDNILLELSCENLSNFYQRCKRERLEFWEIFRWDKEIGDELLTDDFEEFKELRTLFLETLYTYRISQDDVVFYQNFLNSRLKDMEEVIDKYFDLFKPVLLKKMREGFKRDRERQKKLGKEGTLKVQVKRREYEEWALQHSDDVQFDDPEHFPYERKLKILTEYQDDLIQAEKDQKDNRQGIQQICRMTGSLAQSYFIFDSYKYKVGRKIYFAVQEEEDDQEDQDDIGMLLGKDESSSSSSAESSNNQTLGTKRSKMTVKSKSKGSKRSRRKNSIRPT